MEIFERILNSGIKIIKQQSFKNKTLLAVYEDNIITLLCGKEVTVKNMFKKGLKEVGFGKPKNTSTRIHTINKNIFDCKKKCSKVSELKRVYRNNNKILEHEKITRMQSENPMAARNNLNTGTYTEYVRIYDDQKNVLKETKFYVNNGKATNCEIYDANDYKELKRLEGEIESLYKKLDFVEESFSAESLSTAKKEDLLNQGWECSNAIDNCENLLNKLRRKNSLNLARNLNIDIGDYKFIV